jgi:hypothetical protein
MPRTSRASGNGLRDGRRARRFGFAQRLAAQLEVPVKSVAIRGHDKADPSLPHLIAEADPSLPHLIALARFFGVTPNYLLGFGEIGRA